MIPITIAITIYGAVTQIPHLAPDTAPTSEAFTALDLKSELILLELLDPRELHPLPPVILTSAIAD